ncbi:SDR family NAD(P)-dependent oxidoreductase [Rubrobacter tropicus]|uniref:SDR family NAD(P)-dependent oxidoreductase n=1 Tax=Rubrobacter tropicus TaxID=2653851 RepID=A0A6G8Q5C1_9ACTN|nr:SDR family NAD(P)-dependent oxidoreductase [Rubrobacter tropicus]QIN81671.1 SDR family NAD(P)-dependent oxidoreductase [Rubrobacter tropicus]
MRGEDGGTGRTAIITGGNQGLGYQAAKNVAAAGDGWHVVIAGRNEEKVVGAVGRMRAESGNPRVDGMVLDLASLHSVRSFAEAFAAREDLPPLRALVLNAGLQVVSGTTYTEDGFETTFGVNHLGHYLLVNLLVGEMAPPARIVFVSSGTHDPEQRTGMPAPRYRGAKALAWPERYPDPDEEGEGTGVVGRRRYTTSKLANLYTSYELARRLAGSGVTSNAFDPGLMPGTGLARDWGSTARFAFDHVLPLLQPVFGMFGVNVNTVETSGRALARLVTDPELENVSGSYFEGEKEIRSSEQSYDSENAAELWETSAELVGLGAGETVLRIGDKVPKRA